MSARRSKAHPAGLSRERILEAAHAVAAADGLDALSMRRLAQELDVWPMSVYRYFADKDALLDAMAAGAAGTVRAPSGGSWREAIADLLREAERSLSRSSGYARRLPRAALTPDALRVPEAGIAILVGAGLSAADAASAWRTLWSYTYGFATTRVDEDARAAIAALSGDEYPALTATADAVAAALTDDGEFERGLDRLLDAVERSIDAAARTLS